MAEGFIEVAVTADPSLAENLTAVFSQLGFEGFWEDEGTLRCYIHADRWSPAFFEEIQTTAALIARSSFSPSPHLRVRTLENRNWNAEWEKTIRPIRVADHIVIRPSWQSFAPRSGDIVLTIDPKMSFGTGYHETTRLVLRMMETSVRAGMTMLDVGTGTGVLAIAGIKLGCASAIACDVDEWSFQNARDNAEVNGVAGRMQVILGDISLTPATPFDLISANLQCALILSILTNLRARCAPGGLLLLSGLLLQDEEEIVARLNEHEFTVGGRLTEHEWLALAAGPRRTS